MKRIGVITIQKCDNFGADLQAYALGAELRSLGYDAENIDYLFYKNPRHKGSRAEKPVLPISIRNKIKEFLFPIVERIKGIQNSSNRRLCSDRQKRFDEWFKAMVNGYKDIV